MARHLPDIMEDVALAALDRNGTCVKCAGNGNVSGAPCADCRGSGEIRALGDIRSRRLVFEMFGIPYRKS